MIRIALDKLNPIHDMKIPQILFIIGLCLLAGCASPASVAPGKNIEFSFDVTYGLQDLDGKQGIGTKADYVKTYKEKLTALDVGEVTNPEILSKLAKEEVLVTHVPDLVKAISEHAIIGEGQDGYLAEMPLASALKPEKSSVRAIPFMLMVDTDGLTAKGGASAEAALGALERDRLQENLNRMVADLISQDDRFYEYKQVSRETTLPDDFLMMVITFGKPQLLRNEIEVLKAVRFDSFLTADLQLVDPMTGQVVYGLADFFARANWSQDGKHYKDSPNYKEPPAFYIGRDSPADQFTVLAKKAAENLTGEMLRKFKPQQIAANVAIVLNKRKRELVFNKGRIHGVFPKLRLHSKSGKIATVTESHPNYSIARLMDDQPVKGEQFMSFSMFQGSTVHPALTAVTRIVFSNGVLKHPRLKELAEDELLEGNNPDPKPSVFQSLFSKELNDNLIRSDKFRMSYPVGGLSSLKKAKQKINDQLNLKRKEEDPFFFESFIMPDYGVTAIVSNLRHWTRRKMSAGKVREAFEHNYRVMVSLHLYDLRSGQIIASSVTNREEKFDEAYRKGETTMRYSHDMLIVNLIRGALVRASNLLGEKYQPTNITGHIPNGNSKSVEIKLDENSAYIGQLLTMSTCDGEQLALEPDGEKIDIYRDNGTIRIVDRVYGQWIADFVEEGPGFKEGTKNRVVLYGLNNLPGKPQHRKGTAKVEYRGSHPNFDRQETEYMLFAYVASDPQLQVVFPPEIFRKVRWFDDLKFKQDGVFQLANGGPDVMWHREGPSGLNAFLEIKKASAREVSR